jgi:hypothetical protein
LTFELAQCELRSTQMTGQFKVWRLFADFNHVAFLLFINFASSMPALS